MSGTQARGYKGKVVMDFEASFGVAPSTKKPFGVPFNSFDVKATQSLDSDPLIRGTRNPAAPGMGNKDVSGSAEVPMDAHSFGLWLRAMFGLPTTTVVAAVVLTAGSAVDKGSGKVGLPSTAHGLEPGTPVIISGTDNYDGDYLLASETSTNELVITATYAVETVSGTDTVTPGHRLTLDAGDAVDKSGGLVGLPVTAHGLPVGAEVTVVGTTNYDATYTVKRGTSADEIVVTASYSSETFDGTETVDCLFHSHVYVIGDTQPSMVAEKQFPDIPVYLDADGLKVGSASFKAGGSGVVGVSLNLSGRDEAKKSAAYDAEVAAVQLPLHRFSQSGARISEGGSVLADRLTSVDVSMGFELDTGDEQYTIGSGGVRGNLPEGIMNLSGSCSGLFVDTRFLDKAEIGERTAISLAWINGGYALTVDMAEAMFERSSPGIPGPKGILESFSYTAFHDTGSAGSAVVITLKNDIKTWME